MEKRSTPSHRRRTVIRWYVGVVITVTVIGILRFVLSDDTFTYHFDYDIYRGGGRAVLDGTPLYSDGFRAQGITLPFTYPPLSALVFAPLALVSGTLGYLTFTVLSIIGLALTVMIVVRALATEHVARTLPTPTNRQLVLTALMALPVAVWLWPVTHTLEFGQINILLMLMVAADLLLPRTPWPRGMLIGFAAALKLTPAVFGLYFLLRRQWGPAITSVVSGIGATAAAWLVLPTDSRQYWTETISDPSRIGGLAYSANQSLRGFLARFTGDPLQTTLWYILAAVTVIAVALVMLRLITVGALTAAVCTNALLALLVSPVSWAHHWVWVLPMLLVVGVSLWTHRRTRTAALPLTVLALLLALTATAFPVHVYLPSAHGAEEDWAWWMKILGSEYVLVAVAWLGVAGVRPGILRPGGGRNRDRDVRNDGGRSGDEASSPTPAPPPVPSPPDTPSQR
ncbi:Putative membrane protein [Corynebacterium glyciniphilum AJ 3170]|uniref:Putative membrane protein n=1 Tax=Corynebacterium glyciniphilum AJ 3170 TaxID=1404245 RepID=X5DMR0_9CORY|nr:glycosyltransferase 87 family protein [Corynebacterium glyciniphilum]AHW64408.1 Putative membrane protein [Corynebacterium glyciniphilum AJ 3170]